MNQIKNKSVYCILLFFFLFPASCSNTNEHDMVDAYIIKSGDIIVMSSQFIDELELKKIGYSYDIKDNASEYNNIVMQVVEELSEEIVLLHIAGELEIIISEEEVIEAEQQFLKDYPDDTFKQMLLINAIKYSFWKKRFRKKLIIDKLIQKELREKIIIKTEDVMQFYDQYKSHDKKEISENELILQLREQKTEEKYSSWIDEAIVKYPAEINAKELKKFLIGLEEKVKIHRIAK